MLPRVRTQTLSGFAELARSSGLDPASLMADLGMDIADLDAPDAWLPAAAVARLLDVSARRSGCPDFGLRMAELRRLGTLGPLSVVLRDEPDLRSAVDLLIRYERAYNEALHLRLHQADGQATLEVWLELGEPAPSEPALDLVMAALLGIIRALVRSDWQPLAASFSRSAPDDVEPWRRVFGPGTVFDRGFTGLVFSARELAAPIALADSSLRPYTRAFLRTVVDPRAPAATSGLQDVADTVELLLPLGRGSMTHVARYLGLTPGGLRRFLAEHGQTFSSVVHTTRGRLAERYLPNPRYSLTEVSQLLGFQAPSAFSRWFRQQFGRTPTEWRQAGRAPVPEDGGTVREG